MAAILTKPGVNRDMANSKREDDDGNTTEDGCQDLEQRYTNNNVGQEPSHLLPSEQEKDENEMRKAEVDLPPTEEKINTLSLQKKVGDKSRSDVEGTQNGERRRIAEECHRAIVIAQEKKKTRLQSYERSSCIAADRRDFADVIRPVAAERCFWVEEELAGNEGRENASQKDSEMGWRERMGRMERELGEFVERERKDVGCVKRELERRDWWRFEAGFISAREMDELQKLREERNFRREVLVRS